MATIGERLSAILRQRCPRCLQGKVFRGQIAMNQSCPVCGHRFEREPGYFLGAMYASYFISIPTLVLLTVLLKWLVLQSWEWQWVALLAEVPFLLLVPTLFRYARMIWLHLDPPRDGV